MTISVQFLKKPPVYESRQTRSHESRSSNAARTFLCRTACGHPGRAFLEKFFAGLRSFLKRRPAWAAKRHLGASSRRFHGVVGRLERHRRQRRRVRAGFDGACVCTGRWAPVRYAKFFAPVALFILGLGAWTFFRQLKLSPLAAVLGGLAAALNSAFFSTACWGVASQQIAVGMTYFALALVVSNTPETPG